MPKLFVKTSTLPANLFRQGKVKHIIEAAFSIYLLFIFAFAAPMHQHQGAESHNDCQLCLISQQPLVIADHQILIAFVAIMIFTIALLIETPVSQKVFFSLARAPPFKNI